MSEDQKNDLLDMFAARAMSGLLAYHGSSRAKDSYSESGSGFRTLAETSYEVALSMVKHKERFAAMALKEEAQRKLNQEQKARMAAKFPGTIDVDN